MSQNRLDLEIEADSSQARKSLEDLARELDGLAGEARKAGASSATTAADIDKLGSKAQVMQGQFVAMAASMAAAFSFREVVDAAAKMEQLKAGLTAVTQSSQEAAKDMEFLRGVAQRIGADVAEVGKAYLSLSASTKGTAVEGEATRKAFEAVATAMGKAGKSSAETSNALLALGQMASKGVVQAEELRGQLGEALPGALQAAAKGMGVTTAELMKLVEEGRITAQDIFPALTRGLNTLYGGAPQALTLSQQITNIKNALVLMSERIGESGGLAPLKVGAQAAEAAILLLGNGLVAAGQKIGVLAAAAASMDFSRVSAEFKEIEMAAQRSFAQAAQHNEVLRSALQASGQDAVKTALAVEQAGAAATASGAAAQEAGTGWVQLGNGYRLVLESLKEQITETEKSVAAREAEGKAAIEQANAFGSEQEKREAVAKATATNAAELERLRQLRADELATMRAQLSALQAEISAKGAASAERQKQIADLQKIIDLRSQEAAKTKAQADSARIAAAAAAQEAGAYKQTAESLAALAGKYLAAQQEVLRLQQAQKAGNAIEAQVVVAKAKAEEASKRYSDGLTVEAQRIKSTADLERSALQLKQSSISAARVRAQVALEQARASGDEEGAARRLVDVQRLEAQQGVIVAQQKRAEAQAALDSAKAKKAAAEALGDLTPQQAAEAQAAINSAQALLNEAQAAATLAAELLRLRNIQSGGAGGNQSVGDSAEEAGEQLKGMGESAEKAGQQTAEAAEQTTQAGGGLLSMWWRGSNAASQYAQAVNKAMWEQVHYQAQSDLSFAALSHQANLMVEALERLDAAQQSLEASTSGSVATIADLRLRLLEVNATEEELAAARAARDRAQVQIEIEKQEIELERARLWKDHAKVKAVEEEIARQREILELLSQIEKAESRKRADGNSGHGGGGGRSGGGTGIAKGGGGDTYLSNIVIGNKKTQLSFTDRQSQTAADQLVRELASARQVAQ